MDGITLQPHLAGHAGVCEIILDRPEALNAIDTAMAVRLAQACGELAADRGVRAVVLSAAGDRAFCVGADLKERNRLSDAAFLAQREVFRAAFGGLLSLPQPVIAAVHGYALGGGCELALSADLIVADETAVFGLPETTVGLVPGGGGTQLAQRKLGPGRAADLIFTGRRVPAEEAERIGLADRRVPAGKAAQHALDLAAQIAANSPVAVRAAKRAIRQGGGIGLAAAMEVEDAAWRAAAFSADRREGIAAFNEKRAPRWPGE
ncbi:MAG TPA: enoyl-CoA hydratase [Actinobacteria bacterium]|nr:enoyl-CoA hydratase [Actinomycetota bacterium]